MNTSTGINYCLATKESELMQILELQRKNLPANISEETKITEGFVTVQHTLPLLVQMNAMAQQVIAKDGDTVIAYALVMRPELRTLVPVLVPMFTLLDSLYYKGKSLKDWDYYAMGQICVAEEYRRLGVFDGLYQKHKESYSGEYGLCVTEVSTRNFRSMRAHHRVGFKVLHTFRDATDEWNIVVWDWDTYKA